MEENKNKTEAIKLTYEQLEQVASQIQQKLIIAENKLRTIDFASVRLNWLFKVIENKLSFTTEFVNRCSKEIEDLLTIEEEVKENIE